MRYAIMTMSILAACLLTSCNKSAEDATEHDTATTTPLVMTTFYPTAYFTQRIVGDRVTVTNPVPPTADPIFYQPSDDDLVAYQSADLIIINGGEFEKWIANAALPRSRVIDSSANLDAPFLTYETALHSHGPEGEHTHEGIDGHTWLDPLNAIAQAQAILAALTDRYPEHAELFRTNFAALVNDLEDLDKRWAALAPGLSGITLLASHPAYGYLARRYRLELVTLDLDPESELDADDIAAIRTATQSGATDRIIVLLWESEPLAESVDLLRDELGVRSIIFSPVESLDAAQQDAGEDFLSIMNANLDRLEAALN